MSQPRGAADIEHFSGTVLKKLKDGTTVASSYVDAEAGDELLAGVEFSDKVEAAEGDEKLEAKAGADASKTAPAKDDDKKAPAASK